MKKFVFLAANSMIIIFLLVLILQRADIPLGGFGGAGLLTGHATRIPTAEDLDIQPEDIERMNQYDPLIGRYCAEMSSKDETQSECMFISKAIIASSSMGDQDYVSRLGSAGVMPLSASTAQEYRFEDIFSKLTGCCSDTGKSRDDCSVQPACSSSENSEDYDERFDPEKSIKAGISHMMSSYTKYRGNLYLVTIAFFGSQDTAEKTLQELSEGRHSKSITKSRIIKDGEDAFKELSDMMISDKDIRIEMDAYLESKLDKMEGFYSFWAQKKVGGSPSFRDIINQFGLYKVNPSFSVMLDYNITEYSSIMDDARLLVEQCSGKPQLEECIADQAREFGVVARDFRGEPSVRDYRWHLGGCEDGERSFEQLIEDYELCINSERHSSQCYCDLNLEGVAEEMEIVLNKKNQFGKEVIEVVMFHEGDEREFVLEGDTDLKLCYFRERSGFMNFFGQDDSYVTDAETLTLESSDDGLVISESGGRTLSDKLYKLEDGTVCFIPSESISEGNVEEEIPSCTAQKQYYRFCVESEQELFSKKEIPETGEQISFMEPVRYKFALYFKDDPPPKITGLRAYDKPKHRNATFIIFDRSEAEDVDYYNIYYQDKELHEIRREDSPDTSFKNIRDMSVTQMKDSEFITKKTFTTGTAELNKKQDMPVSFDCTFDYASRACKYPVYSASMSSPPVEMEFQDNVPYSFENSQRYIYPLPLEAGKSYTVAVTAVDHNGNELSNTAEETIAFYDISSDIIEDDLYFWRIPRENANIMFSGTAMTWGYPEEYENRKEVREETPESYSVFFYEALNFDSSCKKTDPETMSLYAENIRESDLPLTIEPSRMGVKYDETSYYCFGVLAERHNKRNYAISEDFESAKNLISFAVAPQKVPVQE